MELATEQVADDATRVTHAPATSFRVLEGLARAGVRSARVTSTLVAHGKKVENFLGHFG